MSKDRLFCTTLTRSADNPTRIIFASTEKKLDKKVAHIQKTYPRYKTRGETHKATPLPDDPNLEPLKSVTQEKKYLGIKPLKRTGGVKLEPLNSTTA